MAIFTYKYFKIRFLFCTTNGNSVLCAFASPMDPNLHWVVSFSVPFCLILPVTVLLWQANNLLVSYLVASFAALLWKSAENTKLLVQTSSQEHGRGLEDKVRMWPARAPPLEKRGWRGIITYCTLTQLFHNTWRQHIRSFASFGSVCSWQITQVGKRLLICAHTSKDKQLRLL